LEICGWLLWNLGPRSLLAEIVVQDLGLGRLICGPVGLLLELLLQGGLLVG